MSMTRVMPAVAITLAVLTGCGAGDSDSPAKPEAAASDSTTAGVPAKAQALLATYGLDGMGTVEVINRLDRLGGDERPADLMASVRPGELVLTADEQQHTLDIPHDRFYLSVAPYVDQTHECFHHSLTTCQGELVATDVQVQITDSTSGRVLVDETRTTSQNGFVGFWLPRDINGTITVSYDGKAGEVDFSTGEEAPTCLTTLQMA